MQLPLCHLKTAAANRTLPLPRILGSECGKQEIPLAAILTLAFFALPLILLDAEVLIG